MKRFFCLANLLALVAAATGGCADYSSSPASSTAPIATTPIDSDAAAPAIAELNGLSIVDVGPLLVAMPAGSTTECYGVPCPEWKAKEEAELARQLPRLQELVNLAQAAVETAAPTRVVSDAEVATDLQTLRDRYIVTIGDVVVDVPQPSQTCGNTVCPDDQAKADAFNQQLRSELATFAEQAEAI